MSDRTGRFFEDFALGEIIRHAVPRTITTGDCALYTALYGSRFALSCADSVAQGLGLPRAPVDDLLVFHVVFGKSVPDISLNAIANLGYADGRFHGFVYPGDTLSAHSEVIGLRETSNGRAGIVYVRTTGSNQRGETVLEYVRWVMVRRRDGDETPVAETVPQLPDAVAPADIAVPAGLDLAGFDPAATGDDRLWEDFPAGTRIDHVDGMTVEEADHMMATRLYQNTARVHFNLHAEKEGRFGRRIVYGGHVISLARAFSVNGLANAFRIAAINGGRHVAPVFAGDTIYAWSEVLDVSPLDGRSDLGALRLRMVATKDRPCGDHPLRTPDGAYDPAVVLDFDCTVLMPRRPA